LAYAQSLSKISGYKDITVANIDALEGINCFVNHHLFAYDNLS
jgi:hypothetical protein